VCVLFLKIKTNVSLLRALLCSAAQYDNINNRQSINLPFGLTTLTGMEVPIITPRSGPTRSSRAEREKEGRGKVCPLKFQPPRTFLSSSLFLDLKGEFDVQEHSI